MIQPVKEKIILGIDPGTTIMGYGVLRVTGTKPEMIAMGIIDLRKFGDHYLKLRHIHERVLGIIESYLPDELAIEANPTAEQEKLITVIGKDVGDQVEFGGLLGYAPIMPVNEFSCDAFVNRGGRIPAPIHSFKN